MPDDRPGRRGWRAPESRAAPVGVDVVAGPGGVGLRGARGPRRSRRAARRPPGPTQREVVVEPDVRPAGRGAAGPDSIWPTMATPVVVEVEQGDRRDAERAPRRSDPGTSGSQRFSTEHHGEAQQPRRRASASRVSPRWRISPQACSKKLPVAFSHAEQLRQLPDDDREGEPDDEPLEHRLGDERGEEAEPQQPGEDADDPGDDGQDRGRRRRTRSLPPSARSATIAGGQRRGGRHGADHQVPGACRAGRRAPAPGRPRRGRPPAGRRRWSRTPATPGTSTAHTVRPATTSAAQPRRPVSAQRPEQPARQRSAQPFDGPAGEHGAHQQQDAQELCGTAGPAASPREGETAALVRGCGGRGAQQPDGEDDATGEQDDDDEQPLGQAGPVMQRGLVRHDEDAARHEPGDGDDPGGEGVGREAPPAAGRCASRRDSTISPTALLGKNDDARRRGGRPGRR